MNLHICFALYFAVFVIHVFLSLFLGLFLHVRFLVQEAVQPEYIIVYHVDFHLSNGRTVAIDLNVYLTILMHLSIFGTCYIAMSFHDLWGLS